VHGLILAQEGSNSLRYALKTVSPDIQLRQLHLEVTVDFSILCRLFFIGAVHGGASSNPDQL
jgi:hypothetical protein